MIRALILVGILLIYIGLGFFFDYFFETMFDSDPAMIDPSGFLIVGWPIIVIILTMAGIVCFIFFSMRKIGSLCGSKMSKLLEKLDDLFDIYKVNK